MVIMKASEFRIGNLLEWEDDSHEIVKITAIKVKKDSEPTVKFADLKTGLTGGAQLSEFIPVVLKDDVLKRFQFKQERLNLYIRGHMDYSYCLESRASNGFKDGGYFMGIRFDDWDADPHTIQRFAYELRYAHTLQNIWYGLTNTELVYNPS